MILKDKERNKIVHKYKIGQQIYVYEDGYLRKGLIIGIEFSYNSDLDKRALTHPQYAVMINIGTYARQTIYKQEYEVFESKYDCVMYALEHGLVEEK